MRVTWRQLYQIGTISGDGPLCEQCGASMVNMDAEEGTPLVCAKGHSFSPKTFAEVKAEADRQATGEGWFSDTHRYAYRCNRMLDSLIAEFGIEKGWECFSKMCLQ